MKHGYLLLLVTSGVLILAGDALPSGNWQRVAHEDGITLSIRDVPGRGFPTFRGVGAVDANIYDVVAVISDIGRHTEWMERCRDAQLLRKESERLYIVYSRTRAIWPVADRDAVYRSEATVDAGHKQVTVKFTAIRSPLKDKVKGVVRMEKLQGYYKLSALGSSKTWVEFEVDADPGGMLPTWIAKLATRRLPLHTIRNLRKQVARTRGWYQDRIRRWRSGAF
jgi:hypothetical protein